MTDKKELWLGEIPLFTEHEKHEGNKRTSSSPGFGGV